MVEEIVPLIIMFQGELAVAGKGIVDVQLVLLVLPTLVVGVGVGVSTLVVGRQEALVLFSSDMQHLQCQHAYPAPAAPTQPLPHRIAPFALLEHFPISQWLHPAMPATWAPMPQALVLAHV